MPFPPRRYRRLRDLGDRILFGSDFPNIPYSYADALSAVTDLPRHRRRLVARSVLHDNAARLFGTGCIR